MTLSALAFSLGAAGATLGEIEVRSRPGEVLDARIFAIPSPGEPLEANCVSVSRGAASEGPFVTSAKVGVEQGPAGTALRIRSVAPIADPATKLRVVVRCPGQSQFAYREYRGLFAPQPPPPGPIALPLRAGTTAEPVPFAAPLTTGFPVIAGDTFESLALKFHPRNAAAREAYTRALRQSNPELVSLGDQDLLPEGSRMTLPELRAFGSLNSTFRPAVKPSIPPAQAPRLAAAPSGTRQPREAAVPPRKEPRAARAPEKALPSLRSAPPVPAPTARARTTPGGASFTLRLSSPEIDLSRSRGIDDATRARIRDRQLVLDADDQVAAFLSLRDSVRRLETTVAQLQLKLSGMPATFPAVPAREPATPKTASAPQKMDVGPPKLEAPPPKVEPSPPKVEPPPSKVELPSPRVEVAPPKVDPAPRTQAPKAVPAPRPRAVPEPESEGLPAWLWVVAAALVALAAALGRSILRRRRVPVPDPKSDEMPQVSVPPVTSADPEAGKFDHLEIAEGQSAPPITDPMRGRRVLESDAGLATEVSGGDAGALRRRYIEERFPEIVNRTIVLDDADSVVKAARLFYEDGATSRAVELLQFATEENPGVVKPWLALFEIHRLERQSGEFAELARKFKDRHGDGDYWRKVQFFGREIEPANALYRDLAVDIETIKFEVGKPPAAAAFDPVAENWLNAPMDFENEVLANDLRCALMQGAGLKDEDLVPNPMPALRSVEMFSVA